MDPDSILVLLLSSCLLQLYHLVGRRTYCIFSPFHSNYATETWNFVYSLGSYYKT